MCCNSIKLVILILLFATFSIVYAPKTVDHFTANMEKSCPSNSICSELPANCFDCDYNYTCVYGVNTSVTCTIKDEVKCQVIYYDTLDAFINIFLHTGTENCSKEL